MDEARPPFPALPPAEPRAASLDLQVEQVTLALSHLRDTQARLEQMEGRLAAMTETCAGILDRWARNDERHASAVLELHTRLSEWNDIERKLLTESASRIHQFEQGLEHEWQALRQKHEAPIQRLDTQASRINETCLAAVQAAVQGCERAEARLAGMGQQVAREMTDLSREVREALGELRVGAAALPPSRPWPLEHVVRLHGALRAEANDEGLAIDADHAGMLANPHPVLVAQTRAPALGREARRPAGRLPGEVDERPAPPGVTELRSSWLRPAGLTAAALVVAAIVALGVLGMLARADARAAAARADVAERELSSARAHERERLAEVERSTEARLAAVQQAARSAQMLAGVLGSPDLLRFALVPRPGTDASSGQVMWSRSQGVAFTAARLPAPPAGRGYQLWLLVPGRAVSVGLLQPEASGRTSGTFDPPADLPRPVVGALVTAEPAGGAASPSGQVVLRTPPSAVPAVPAPQS